MSKELKVEYKILSVNPATQTAKVRFVNPFTEGKDDEVNVDHVRDVPIPLVDGEADAEAFTERLEQLSMAQLHKMQITKDKAKVAEDSFKAILKLGKGISIEKPEEAAPKEEIPSEE